MPINVYSDIRRVFITSIAKMTLCMSFFTMSVYFSNEAYSVPGANTYMTVFLIGRMNRRLSLFSSLDLCSKKLKDLSS